RFILKGEVMVTTNISSIDPVCGMTVNPGEALRSQYKEKSYFFCSAGCQRKFAADPAGVLAARAEKVAAQKHAQEVAACCRNENHGGASTIVTDSSSDSGAVYTCPMHAEIEQIGPGDCPICGMDLEPKFV